VSVRSSDEFGEEEARLGWSMWGGIIALIWATIGMAKIKQNNKTAWP
jgi:hypothetical protein